jgi:cyclohexadienyl dehydratase
MPVRLLKAFLVSLLVVAAAGGPASAGDRLDAVLKKTVLRVGTPGDYRPFAMLADGKYEGFDVDMIALMAKELGVSVEFVPTTWRGLLPDLQADKYDVAIGGITRNVARMSQCEFLPGYAPFGKVALVRAADKDRFTTLDSLNQPDVRVIKNPGGTNEKFVLEFLTRAKVATHEKNAEIPALIAEGKGDVMITETYEALLYAGKDSRLHAAFIDKPLTKANTLGFMLPKDDADFVRVMNFLWETLVLRGEMDECVNKWLR